MSALAARLKQERRNQSLSQVALAARMGVRQSSISDWERGARDPSLLSLERWVEGLGLALTLTPVRAAGRSR